MRMLENVYPQVEIDKHDCSILAYVDDEQRYLCEDSMKKNEKLSKEDDEEIQWVWTLITGLMKVKDENIYKIFTNSIIFKMFQSLRFKNLLALNYVANYNFITEDFGEMNSYSHLGVQILTIPEVALNILQNVELSE